MKDSKFPKLKKKLKGFLTEESWKISKKDALGLWAASAVMASWTEMAAGRHNNFNGTCYQGYYVNPVHHNWYVNWHYNMRPTIWYSSTKHYNHNSHGSHGSHGSRW